MVERILIADAGARDDDHYLYCKVVEEIDPKLLNTPFIVAFTNPRIPKFESVRRVRQKLQAENEELAASADTECARELKEEEFRGFAING